MNHIFELEKNKHPKNTNMNELNIGRNYQDPINTVINFFGEIGAILSSQKKTTRIFAIVTYHQ